MDKSGYGIWINTFYSRLVICSSNSWNMFPLFRWGNYRWLAPAHKPVWVAWSGQDIVMSQPIWYITDSARNSKIQMTGKSFWVQCPTFTTSLSPSPHLSPQITQRTVSLGFFLTPNMWLHPPTPFSSQHQLGSPHSIDFWYSCLWS